MQPAAGRYTLRGGQEMQLSELFPATLKPGFTLHVRVL